MNDLTCPRCCNPNVCGVAHQGVYDGVLYWECLACHHRWHRWPVDAWQHSRATKYVEAA